MEANTPALGEKPVMFYRKLPTSPQQKIRVEETFASDLAPLKVYAVDACINSVIGGFSRDSSTLAS